MSREEKPELKKRTYTTGAMCFMLFIWLGGVLALCAFAAVVMQ